MDRKKEQRLREEGFADCTAYIRNFNSLKKIIPVMNLAFKLKGTQNKEIMERLIEESMISLEQTKTTHNEIEKKYKSFLKKYWNRFFPVREYEALLKNFAESHRRLTEYAAYSELEVKV